MRNYLALLAVIVRLVTLWAFLSTTLCRYVASDLYWGSRQGTPEYTTFMTVLDKATDVREVLLRGGDLDHDSSRELAARMQNLNGELDYWLGLFTGTEVLHTSENSYSAFYIVDGWLYVLKSEEQYGDGFYCDYSEFAY